MAERKVFHSTHKGGNWRVSLDGEVVASFELQREAEQDAIARAKKIHSDGGLAQVVCHNRNGGITEEFTYGKDPERHKG